MTIIVAVLCATVVLQGAIGYLRDKDNATERSELLAEMRRVHRQAMRAVMSKNGVDFDVAEARGALLEQMGADKPERESREPDPAYEGLG